MRIENCAIRVNKHSSATEVFVSNESGVNTAFYLPPNVDVDPTKPIEFVPATLPPAPKEETKPAEATK